MVQRLHDNRITALYCRLSRDDGYADDSCSIDSQKSMLREYAINEGFDRCEFFVDDGFSGTNFDRPDFSRMIDMIEHNMVGTLVVKDLSSQNKLIIVLNIIPIICKNVRLMGDYLDLEACTDYNDHRYYSHVQEVKSWEE